MYKKLRPVEIEWEDAMHYSGYYNKNDPSTYQTDCCRTVGYLIKKNRQIVSLISDAVCNRDTSGYDRERNVTTIPRRMVKRILYLKRI